jgi:hypothetical protein
MIKIVEDGNAPRHLVLGEIAYNGVTGKLKERLNEIESLQQLTLSADFPK